MQHCSAQFFSIETGRFLHQSLSLAILILLLIKEHTVAGDDANEEMTDDQLIQGYIDNPTTTNKSVNSSVAPQETTTTPSETEKQIHSKISANESEANTSTFCLCVKYYLCDIDNGTVIQDGSGAGLLDVRLNPQPKCKNDYEICCKVLKPPNGTLPTAPEQTNSTSSVDEPKYSHTVCGKRHSEGLGLRISGVSTETRYGEFPWMAAVLKREFKGDNKPISVFQCGGSLIHPKVILTAAHCVYKKKISELIVRLGEWDTQAVNEMYPNTNRQIEKIIIHDRFFPGTLHNDIALLLLDKEVSFAPNIDTICLVPTNFNFNGKECFASGWGKNHFGNNGSYQVVLKKVEIPIVSHTKCQSELRKTRLGPAFLLHDSFVCAGGESGKDTCQGDGGSPLVCQFPNSPYYVQYGIVAWGIGCGGDGTPGVYVNVPSFVSWITDQFISNRLDTSYYKSTLL